VNTVLQVQRSPGRRPQTSRMQGQGGREQEHASGATMSRFHSISNLHVEEDCGATRAETSVSMGIPAAVGQPHWKQPQQIKRKPGEMQVDTRLPPPEYNAQTAAGPTRPLSARFTEEDAVQVFLCRPTALGKRSFDTASLARRIGERHGVTSKAIRDVWNRRSWAWATQPHWTEREQQDQLLENLCGTCRTKGVARIVDACDMCSKQGVASRHRRRGRPAGAKDSYQRNRRSSKEEATDSDEPEHEVQEGPEHDASSAGASMGVTVARVTGTVIIRPDTLHIVQACAALKALHASSPIHFEGQSILHWLHPQDARAVWCSVLALQHRLRDTNALEDDMSASAVCCPASEVRMVVYSRRAAHVDFEWCPCSLQLRAYRPVRQCDVEMRIELTWVPADDMHPNSKRERGKDPHLATSTHGCVRDVSADGCGKEIRGVYAFNDVCSDLDLLPSMHLEQYISNASMPSWLTSISATAIHHELQGRESMGVCVCTMRMHTLTHTHTRPHTHAHTHTGRQEQTEPLQMGARRRGTFAEAAACHPGFFALGGGHWAKMGGLII